MGNYEFDGEKYRQASKHQKEWGNKLISGLRLTGSETILDIGCGDGVLTEQLSALVPDGKVTGIDASQGMIDTAKKIKRENLSFLLMDINHMNFENQFDIIYSNAALHWVKNHKRLLKASFTALKNNGIISWNFAAHGTCVNFIDTAMTLMSSDPYKEYFVDFEWPWFMPSKAEYEVITADTEFKIINLEYCNVDRYFSNDEEMIKWIDQPSIVPFIKQIPDSMKGNFRNELIDIMIDKCIQPDGRCFETFKRILIQAVKQLDN